VHEDSAEAQESKNPLRVRRKEAQERRRNNVFIRAGEAQSVRSSQRRKRPKVEAFEKIEILPSLEESVQAQEGAQQPSDRLEKRDLDH
jgi:hypothetical protein